MKNISKIALWVSIAIGIIVTLIYFLCEWETVTGSTGKPTSVPTQMDYVLYWSIGIILLSVALLIVFAIKSLITSFQTEPKSAIKTIVTVLAFVALFGICYVLSPATELRRIVNGEEQVFSEVTMKVIDMWIYMFAALLSITALLVVGFAAKRLISK